MNEKNTSLKQQFIKHQMLLRGLMVMMGVVMLLLIGLFPLFKSAGEVLKKIDTRQQEEKVLSQKVALLTQIDQEILRQRTRIIKAALPETKDVIAYLGAVDGLSKELGVSFGGITISPGEVTDQSSDATKESASKKRKVVSKLNVLDSEIKITGNRDGIYSFLRQVEKTLPLMQVSNVNVAKLSSDQYTMSLSLGMLWSPNPESDLKGAISLFNEKEENYFQKLNSFSVYTGSSITESSFDSDRGDLFN